MQISQPEDRAVDEQSFDALVEQFSADLWRLLDQSFNFPYSPALVQVVNSDVPQEAENDGENA
ncbi:MAG: hypothetical protein ACE5OZ_02455 [Candidatus Heimdallarchaeota archaeon]